MAALLNRNWPLPLAASPPLPVLGLMIRPALLPLAVMSACTVTLLEAVKVSVVLALQLTLSLINRLPLPLEPVVVPLLLSSTTLVVFRLADKVLPLISPPLAATVKSC